MPLEKEQDFNTLFELLSSALSKLDPGSLARLRRMDTNGPGEGVFWHLVVDCDLMGPPTGWLALVQLMAELTPKGDPKGNKRRPHSINRPLGTALANSEYPEVRLLRFLQLPAPQRREALQRIVRWLVSKDDGAVDCRDLYWLAQSTTLKADRRLAETYFRAKRAKQSENNLQGDTV